MADRAGRALIVAALIWCTALAVIAVRAGANWLVWIPVTASATALIVHSRLLTVRVHWSSLRS
jgi:hypothetical protein